MENTEIMTNEEVIGEVTEVATSDPKRGVKTLVGIGLGVVAIIAAYKIGKKIVTKVKAAKEEKARAALEADFEEVVENDEYSKETI